MDLIENVWKWKFWFLKVLLVIKYFITNFFSMHYVHFYQCLFIYFYIHINFLFSQSTCRCYSIYCIIPHTSLNRCAKYVVKLFQWKNMESYKTVYLKWRIESNGSWKHALHFNKRAPLFDKSTLLYLEGQVGVVSLLIQSCFWHFCFILRKKIFWKKALFKKTYNQQMLYLPKIYLFKFYCK